MRTPLSFSRRRGSALLMGIVVASLLSILIISFTEKVLRFGKSSQGIEQSTRAYYHATSIIEQQLMATEKLKKQPWTIQSTGALALGSGKSSAQLDVSTGSVQLPSVGQGNSQWDSSKEWNIISKNSPVQIVIPDGIDWNNTKFYFRVPNISGKEPRDTFNSSFGV